jgi:hypothetical protein
MDNGKLLRKDRYRVGEILGAGAFGSAHIAFDNHEGIE